MAIVTNNTVHANPNYTIEKNHHIVTTPVAKEVEAGVTKQCGKAPSLESPDSVVPPPPYEVPIPPQAPATSCSRSAGLYDGLNKVSKSPISISPPSPAPQSSIQSPQIEVPRTSEQVQSIECIDTDDASNPCIEITLSSTSPRGELAAVDLSGFDCGDFPEFLGDETAELLAAFDFGGTYEESNFAQSMSLATDDPVEHRVARNTTLDVKKVNVESSAARSQLFPNRINSSPSPSYNLRGELRYTNHTPGARVPSFSEFDALDDCSGGCCLHRYPPTQSLYSRSTAPASSTSSPPTDQVASPQSVGVQTPRVYASPVPAVHTSTHTHTPIPQDDRVPGVHPTTVISTALTATAKASQNLKRTLDMSSSCQQCGSTSTPLASDIQADTRNSKPNKAMKNIRKLLEMQKTVTELLLDVLDDCPALAEEPNQKRQRQA